jgi:hypothetical protein
MARHRQQEWMAGVADLEQRAAVARAGVRAFFKMVLVDNFV